MVKSQSHDDQEKVLSWEPSSSSSRPTTTGMTRLLRKRSDGDGDGGGGGGGRHDASDLYLFHDGSGSCAMYSQLGHLGRHVYGIASSSISAAQTLEDLAADYIRQAHLDRQDGLVLGGK
jgi:hypothetical protein